MLFFFWIDWYADVTVHVPPSLPERINREREELARRKAEDDARRVRYSRADGIVTATAMTMMIGW